MTGPIEEVRVRPWATVLRVPTTQGLLYFKDPSPAVAHEARLIEILARRRPELVTELVFSDDEGRMLMRSGGESLGRLLERKLDLKYWEQALSLYAELQIDVAADADALLVAGAFDRRSAGLPAVYEGLIAEPAPGQSREEYEELVALAPEVEQVSAELAAGPVPETINNDDLTDGSIFLRDGAYRFLDWGDACVSHPFFALTVTQRVIELRHGLPLRSSEIDRVRAAYLEPFTRFASRVEVEAIVEPARRIGQISRAALWAENPFWDDPDALAWSLRLLLDPEAWRRWSGAVGDEQPPRSGPVS